MKKRIIAGLVCLLYIAVSLYFGATHHHSTSDLQSHPQCAACAWQLGASVDAPPTGLILIPVILLLVGFLIVVPAPSSQIYGLAHERGPPLFSFGIA